MNSNKGLKVYDQVVDSLYEPSGRKDSKTLPLQRSKVTLLARDLASKFKGESVYSGDKKQVEQLVDFCSLFFYYVCLRRAVLVSEN